MTDLTLSDLVDSDEICAACGHVAADHAEELPARCEAHSDVTPCDCDAFLPEPAEADEVAA